MSKTGNHKHLSGEASPSSKDKPGISGDMPLAVAGKKSAGGKRRTTPRPPANVAAAAAAGALPAKLLPPRWARAFPRTRLFNELDRLRSDHAVIWIAAPPGSGKTTLAGDYVTQRKLKSLWYQLDESDSDVASFFHYLGIAAARLGKHRQPLPHLTPEYLAGFPTFTRRFFEKFFARLKAPFVLLFDNYQELAPGSAVHEALAIAVGALPPGATILVTSRVEPPENLARARANGELTVMGWEAELLSNLVYGQS